MNRRVMTWARWACTVACLALAGACAVAALWGLRSGSGTNAWVNIGYGAGGAGPPDAPAYERATSAPWRPPPRGPPLQFTGVFLVELWPRYEAAPYVRSGWLPLWIPLVLAAIPTGLLWRVELRARRRARLGHCPTCGY